MPEIDEITVDEETEVSEPSQSQPAGSSGGEHREKVYSDAYVKARIDKANRRHAEVLASKDERIAELEEASKAAQAELDQLKQEKQANEWREQAAKETGVPANVIKGNSLDEMLEHAQSIKAVMPTYPRIGDSGAPANQTPTKTKDEIKNMTNDREMLAAIKASIGQHD